MELLKLIRRRRSIRRYQERQISRTDMEMVIEAGLYAPNAGGGQRSMIVGVHNAELAGRVGRMNLARFDRSRLAGSYVSEEQPSNIDDPSIQNGFYGAPSVCIVFGQQDFFYSVPDAFCCAENMVLMASALGISSCIVARGEDTFDNKEGEALLREWGIPQNYIARCFVLLGYVSGGYPGEKPRRAGRSKIVEG